jgi:hypothetical protein
MDMVGGESFSDLLWPSLVVIYPYEMPSDQDSMDMVGPNFRLKIQTI